MPSAEQGNGLSSEHQPAGLVESGLACRNQAEGTSLITSLVG